MTQICSPFSLARASMLQTLHLYLISKSNMTHQKQTKTLVLSLSPVNFILCIRRKCFFEPAKLRRVTLHETATCGTCIANVCLSVSTAAALHGEEAGEAGDEHQDRTDRHCCGEVRIGKLSLSAPVARPFRTEALFLRLFND